MNRELESLILALDAYREAGDADAEHRRALYEARLDDLCARVPSRRRADLDNAIFQAYRQWRAAQKKPPILPPRA